MSWKHCDKQILQSHPLITIKYIFLYTNKKFVVNKSETLWHEASQWQRPARVIELWLEKAPSATGITTNFITATFLAHYITVFNMEPLVHTPYSLNVAVEWSTSPDSYAEALRFKSRRRDQLYLPEILCSFQSFWAEAGIVLQIRHDHFHPRPFQFINH
jgi:hypothetical protein